MEVRGTKGTVAAKYPLVIKEAERELYEDGEKPKGKAKQKGQ